MCPSVCVCILGVFREYLSFFFQYIIDKLYFELYHDPMAERVRGNQKCFHPLKTFDTLSNKNIAKEAAAY